MEKREKEIIQDNKRTDDELESMNSLEQNEKKENTVHKEEQLPGQFKETETMEEMRQVSKILRALSEKLNIDSIKMDLYTNENMEVKIIWEVMQAIEMGLEDNELASISKAENSDQAKKLRKEYLTSLFNKEEKQVLGEQELEEQELLEQKNGLESKKILNIFQIIKNFISEKKQEVKKKQEIVAMKKRYRDLQKLLNKDFNVEQLEEIRKGYRDGLSIANIRKYAKENISAEKMEQIRELLLSVKEEQELLEQEQ